MSTQKTARKSADKKSVAQTLKASEKFETDIFFAMSKKLFAECETQCDSLYDITFDLTDGFAKKVTPEMICGDSRIIKILRYCMVPVLSQMKFGQLIGLATTSDFEEEITETGQKLTLLKKVSPGICRIVNDNLDSQRFIWLQESLSKTDMETARKYAKRWTCSLIANQNSSTAFRNWRKELQETTAVESIVKAGYVSVHTRKIISTPADLLPGQFSRECRIAGRNIQKADIVIRLKKSRKLLLLEAKAIGVRIDAFKRVKECREKFDDWKEHFENDVEVGAILSGFVPEREYKSLLNDNGLVFWEHDIDTLNHYVTTH